MYFTPRLQVRVKGRGKEGAEESATMAPRIPKSFGIAKAEIERHTRPGESWEDAAIRIKSAVNPALVRRKLCGD